MVTAQLTPPLPQNEPVRSYLPGSAETQSLQLELAKMASTKLRINAMIGGQSVTTGDLGQVVMPHDHQHVLAEFDKCGGDQVEQAIAAAKAAWPAWSALAWQDRAAVFLKAADLLAGPWRDRLNAATMLGQGKNVMQAEIDAACELIDFWRFNVHYLEQIYREQPQSSAGVWNYLDHRPLEGFVFAVTPFNFTAIGANLPTAPALMGNTVIWKPSNTQMLSAHYTMTLLEAAGLPPGVINLLPGDGPAVGDPCIASPELAGIHFTGSTPTFQHLWREVGNNIANYRSYPRLVGETGGKDFIFAHESADVPSLVIGLLRGAFEFQGQKCSAASRAFIPASLWDEVIAGLQREVATIKQGAPDDFSNFIGAVIDEPSFDKIAGYIAHAKNSNDHELIIGGGCDKSVGYFIEPTVVVANSPTAKLMVEEIFGPVLTLYRYAEDDVDATLSALDSASPYALTGAVFAQDRQVIAQLVETLRFSAGNFYINDKPTGAVVGQQPFGGARASGTNDKAGSPLNLLRWVSPRAIKETFDPPVQYPYPHMD